MHLDIDTNMKMIGKRLPYYATFTVSGDYMHVYVHVEILPCVVCV